MEEERSWRPLSRRADESFDVLHEGVPVWLFTSLFKWLKRFLSTDTIPRLHAILRRILPVNLSELTEEIKRDPDLTLDLIDAVLAHYRFLGIPWQEASNAAERLEALLKVGGSVWTVHWDPEPFDTEYPLPLGLRRRLEPATESVIRETVQQAPDSAGKHLMASLQYAYGRNPVPDEAYDQAVKAVEAALAPVVTPRDMTATLGKMIRALREKPDKWTSVLGGEGPYDVDRVRGILELLWNNQPRHGEPLAHREVSQREAELAVTLAALCVALVVNGGLKKSGDEP